MPLGVVLLFLGGHGQGSQSQRAAAEKAPAGPTRLYFGISACTQCHTKPGESNPVLCRCIEANIWETEDKHKDAFQVLRSERAKEIGELLRIQGPVWEDKSCVSCHGVLIEDNRLRHKTFREEDGVSCVACHGAFREWVALHGDVLERENWRSYSRKLKEEKYGMKDLWDPAQRARLCASCHVGNTAEGKVVTHAMYGAGHPPLPGVEIATFSDAMPRHWQYVKEKKPEVQKMLHFDREAAAFEQTKLVAVSGVVVLREALNLLGSQAALAASDAVPKHVWPELAQFDCSACHQELRKPTWRPKRSSAGLPGMPTIPHWPQELAELVLDQLGGEAKKEFRHKLQEIEKILNSQPFGRPRDISLAAQQALDWLDRRIPELSQKKYDRAVAIQMLHRLCSLSPEGVPDYDSCRQRVWAFQIIYHELSSAPGPRPVNDRAIRQILETLDQKMNLTLPAGRKRSIDAQLKERLKKRGDYEPAELKQALGELAKQLPEK
jgi:hypothetical protein